MPKMYLVSLRWLETEMKPEMIDAVLGSLGDWFRFNGYTWFVWTDSTMWQVDIAVRARLTAKDSVLIIRVDPSEYAGIAPEWVWNWLKSKQQSPF
jgi:hypothetical protein